MCLCPPSWFDKLELHLTVDKWNYVCVLEILLKETRSRKKIFLNVFFAETCWGVKTRWDRGEGSFIFHPRDVNNVRPALIAVSMDVVLF